MSRYHLSILFFLDHAPLDSVVLEIRLEARGKIMSTLLFAFMTVLLGANVVFMFMNIYRKNLSMSLVSAFGTACAIYTLFNFHL